jgi:zinc ribbon protein
VIIFGFSVFYFMGLIGTGQFHCPNCGGDREYKHQTARRFFTLFFIPVIPLDKVGEVVQCQACKVRFDPAVLSRPTSAQLASALPAAMRAAAAAVLRAGGFSDAAARVAVDAVRRAGAPGYDLSQLHADLNQPAEAHAGPLQTLARQVVLEACERYLADAVRIGLADGPLTPAERDTLRWIAGNLGLTPAHAHGVISTVEQSVRPG